jgi:hypothetical protein
MIIQLQRGMPWLDWPRESHLKESNCAWIKVRHVGIDRNGDSENVQEFPGRSEPLSKPRDPIERAVVTLTGCNLRRGSGNVHALTGL